ncbi:hypothetical protein Tco_0546011 [Tanacetum coccineum]
MIKDKGKAIMIEPEVPLKRKDQVALDEDLARNLQAQLEAELIEEERLARKKEEEATMLQGINKEDLQTLWKLVKTKHGDTRPEDKHERVLWGDLKVMFEPDIKSNVWRNLQGYTVTIWKLYDSCGLHFVRFGNVHIFMLIEKRYPLTPITITNMLNKKLQPDY